MFLRYLHFCPDSFNYFGFPKRLDEKAKENVKIYDVTNWNTNYHNKHISEFSKSKGNQTMKFDQLIEYKVRNIFL